ncbi:MAG: hypothetical protein JWR09_5427 [Mucilaginibacter sp.]|nr:hypothetical protein [Mucilaginibacter sp.]
MKDTRQLTAKLLLFCGTASTLLFWLNTIISARVHGHYDHISGTISELGAIGTRSQHLFFLLLLLTALLGILFSAGLFLTARKMNCSIIPVIPVLIFFLANICVAFFPLGNPLHPVAGQFTEVVMLGPLLSMVFWRDKIFFSIRCLSLAALLIFITALLLLLAGWLPDAYLQTHEGLIQRIFHAGWSFWFISLSIFFSKQANQ